MIIKETYVQAYLAIQASLVSGSLSLDFLKLCLMLDPNLRVVGIAISTSCFFR